MSRKFWWGVGLIIFSQAVGWPALALGGALYPVYGTLALKIAGWVYGLTWVTLGLGTLMAGRDGVTYAKEWVWKRLNRGKPPTR
ncbi:hypothetical protein HY522_08660 [bacterium]|nr:hypothetical protein [bacterium]